MTGTGAGAQGRRAISICGVGGQGVVLAGVILGDAAVRAGLWACQSAAYTVAARGGFARSEVIIALSAQPCPLAEEVDLLVALAEEGWQLERTRLAPGAIAVVDESVDAGATTARLITLPLTRMAREAGRPRSANLVGLGVLAGLTDLVPKECLSEAIAGNLGRAAGDLAALEAGYEVGQEYLVKQREG